MAAMHELTKGGNVALPTSTVRATLAWVPSPSTPAVDLSALALTGSGKVADDRSMVFYNNATDPTGRIHHRGGLAGPGTDTVEVDLLGLPDGIEQVTLAASAEGHAFGRVGGMRLTLTDTAGAPLVTMTLGADVETALVAAELYRRAGTWKVRCVSAGYADGLAGLARDYGISVDDDPTPTPAPSAPTPAPQPAAQHQSPPSGGIDWMNPPVPAGYEI